VTHKAAQKIALAQHHPCCACFAATRDRAAVQLILFIRRFARSPALAKTSKKQQFPCDILMSLFRQGR
jgi:hypothetical protein